MRDRSAYPSRRRIYFINPRFQGGTALLLALLVALGGTVFGWRIDREFGQALREISLRGHYPMKSAYEVVGDLLAWHLVALVAGIFLAGAAVFFLLLRVNLSGAARAVGTLRASAEGDLSTPTPTGGSEEFNRFGKQLDAARGETLALLREIRGEAASLASGSPPPEEFRLRWDALKEKIRGIAP